MAIHCHIRRTIAGTESLLTKKPLSKAVGAALVVSAFITGSFAQNTSLDGIDCKLQPERPANEFNRPVTPVKGKTWIVTNPFGNVVTNKDIAGLPKGYWQHTGVDYVLGSIAATERQPIYSAANGVVIFSTRSNKNPMPKRGGLVIVKHSSPGYKYDIPRYEQTFTTGAESFTIKQLPFQTPDVYTYYLHLDPDQITVGQGDQVTLGQVIGQTYAMKDYRSGRFIYPPHSHFEVWKKCATTERDGYDSAGTQFQQGVDFLLIDPTTFLTQFRMVPDRVSKPNQWQIHLNGSENWHDTGIAVEQGQSVDITATGRIIWNPNPENNNTTAGPDGVPYNGYRLQQPQDFPMPEANVASLIMRIGTVKYAVGSRATIHVRESGTIQLMINDRYSGLHDNTGDVSVRIEIVPAPAQINSPVSVKALKTEDGLWQFLVTLAPGSGMTLASL